jgi:hypothetical protein
MKKLALVLVALAMAACGGGSSEVDPAAFGQAASDISKAAQAHASTTAAFTQPSQCQQELSRYGAEMNGMIDRMQGMSGAMDACMTSMGQPQGATMGTTCNAMTAEMQRHMAAACASSSLTDMMSEANTHASKMMGMASSEQSGASSMQMMMGSSGSGMMGSSGMMSCSM